MLASAIMPRGSYDFDIVAMWEAKSDRRTEFVYLLAWPDESAKNARWAKFMADEEWKEIKRVTGAEHGSLVGRIEDRLLLLTSYSPSVPCPASASGFERARAFAIHSTRRSPG